MVFLQFFSFFNSWMLYMSLNKTFKARTIKLIVNAENVNYILPNLIWLSEKLIDSIPVLSVYHFWILSYFDQKHNSHCVSNNFIFEKRWKKNYGKVIELNEPDVASLEFNEMYQNKAGNFIDQKLKSFKFCNITCINSSWKTNKKLNGKRIFITHTCSKFHFCFVLFFKDHENLNSIYYYEVKNTN